MNTTDITKVFDSFIEEYESVDIAESEFKKCIHENSDLRNQYREWCNVVGSTEKRGFADYCEEYINTQNDVWDVLNDYDE